MSNVTIERCLLRIVRRGGWAWGPDPRGLIESALRKLPALLAMEFENVLQEGIITDDVTIPGPVLIALNLKRSDLSESVGATERPGPSLEHHLGSQIREKLPEMITRLNAARAAAVPSPVLEPEGAASQDSAQDPPTVQLLLRWLEQGCLVQRLDGLREEAVALMEWALLEILSPNPPLLEEEAIQELARQEADRRPDPRNEPARRRWRMAQAIEILVRARRAGIVGSAGDLLALIFASLQQPGNDRVTADVKTPGLISTAVRSKLPSAAAPRPVAYVAPALSGDVHIPSALPFLLLRPLARLGYWDTVAAFVEQLREPLGATLLATALAYKVSSPLKNGWQRDEADRKGAAALAGSTRQLADSDLHSFARRAEPYIALLDLFPSLALLPAHAAEKPLWLTQEKDSYVLWEPDGLFPVRCVERIADLFPTLAQWNVSQLCTTLPSQDLHLLHDHGFAFVTSTAPDRSAHWSRVPGERLWSNFVARPWPSFFFFADAPQQEVWRQISEHRSAFPLLPGCALERAMTLCSALGLGSLAWDLWHERETTSPRLALERLGDLNARVSISPERILVRLPLGARYFDLESHGCLRAVPRLPWLSGRNVEFTRW